MKKPKTNNAIKKLQRNLISIGKMSDKLKERFKPTSINLYMLCLFILLIISMCLNIYLAPASEWGFQGLIYKLSEGMILSILFYIIVVVIPEYRVRKIRVEIFKLQFKGFKLECLRIFRHASSSNLVETSSFLEKNGQINNKLLDSKEFSKHFSGENYDRWLKVMEELKNRDKCYLQEIIRAITKLQDDIKYLMSHVNIYYEEEHRFYAGLLNSLYFFQSITHDSDDQMHMCVFFQKVFAGYDIAKNINHSNYINDTISKL